MAGLSKLLIANRGEIALRIMRTAGAMGFRTVAVYSEADADAPHVRAADQAVCIGPPPALESYLSIDNIIDAARKTGADALHPGYGFLAENPDLAERCEQEGIAFVGPPAEAIRLMGDKSAAKASMTEADVPIIPGYYGSDQSETTLTAEAKKIGFPLLVKAVAGGGGRGMRIVRAENELEEALASARSEATTAFGNGDLLLERFIQKARHVEIQVFADTHGNALHLGERECSAQRRHQKIIEESPSPAVDADLRARMGEAAVKAARAIGYRSAGTVEFILDEKGQFYFMEMNTRLQVEHPVTEMLTGLDLVAWQLLIADGAHLPLSQDRVTFLGHAIEARIYAEDPYCEFLPQSGPVRLWRPVSSSAGVRIDAGVSEGQHVSDYYDPLIAKVIAHGATREIARRRLITAIQDSPLLGLVTNRTFLCDLLADPTFVEGNVTTAYIDEKHAAEPPKSLRPDGRTWSLAALLFSLPDAGSVRDRYAHAEYPDARYMDPWRTAEPAAWPVMLRHEAGGDESSATENGHRTTTLAVSRDDRGGYTVTVNDTDAPVRLALLSVDGPRVRFEADGVQEQAWFVRDGDRIHLEVGGTVATFHEPRIEAEHEAAGPTDGQIRSPMSARVLKIQVKVGDEVEKGQSVAIVEAMKIEHRVRAAAAGKVSDIQVAEGDQVSTRQVLITVELPEAEPLPTTDSGG